jgi:hypothetical protein
VEVRIYEFQSIYFFDSSWDSSDSALKA